MDRSLVGKTFVVTGATSGIGLAAAEILAAQGARVIGVGRSPERGVQTEQRLQAAYPDARMRYLTADLALQSEVRRLANDIRDLVNRDDNGILDGLINNAGTFTFWQALTAEGFETQWAVNHLAPFLLTNELLSLLQVAPMGRVVTVSSGSHYGASLNWDDLQLHRRYNGLRAYGQTKLANVLFTVELHRMLGSTSSVKAFAADPGLVKTDIGLKDNPALARWVWKWRSSSGISPEESARWIAYLATEPSIQNATDVYWQHGEPKSPSPRALDEEAAWWLWEISAGMCGLDVEPTS
jgi:retinol dehydrogenase 12